MHLATYTPLEFFYNDFEDYVNFSGVPYTSKKTKTESSLAIEIAKFDRGEGVLLSYDQIERLIPNINQFDEFLQSKIHFIDTPVFAHKYIDINTLSIEKTFVNVSTYITEFDNNFIGERFTFSNDFYLYSIQFYSDDKKYYMKIRGYETQ